MKYIWHYLFLIFLIVFEWVEYVKKSEKSEKMTRAKSTPITPDPCQLIQLGIQTPYDWPGVARQLEQRRKMARKWAVRSTGHRGNPAHVWKKCYICYMLKMIKKNVTSCYLWKMLHMLHMLHMLYILYMLQLLHVIIVIFPYQIIQIYQYIKFPGLAGEMVNFYGLAGENTCYICENTFPHVVNHVISCHNIHNCNISVSIPWTGRWNGEFLYIFYGLAGENAHHICGDDVAYVEECYICYICYMS